MNPNAALLLLDRSGSMANCVDLTVDGVNTFLQRLRDDESGRGAQIELITFDSQGFDTIRKGSIEEVRNITTSEYQPRSMTPLYDAVQHAIERLNDTPANRRMLIILTDGKENASKRMNLPGLRRLISAAQERGFIIIYLAAHVDAWEQAERIGIPRDQAMNFRAGPARVKAGGIRGVFGGTKMVNPIAIALGAAAGVGLMSMSASGVRAMFSEDDRNAAMGVADGWRDAVLEDIATFEEPFTGLFDMPPELAAAEGNLPADFDPSAGSLNENGEQPGVPDGDILDQRDLTDHRDEWGGEPVTETDSITPASVDTTPPSAPAYEPERASVSHDTGSSWGGSSDSGSSWNDSGSSNSGGGSSY